MLHNHRKDLILIFQYHYFNQEYLFILFIRAIILLFLYLINTIQQILILLIINPIQNIYYTRI